ncbi:MAG: hypothetical protein GXO48_09485 [Chlorobi bacterium]|nr:hypothetical protein [Chlorobiota bacterium]
MKIRIQTLFTMILLTIGLSAFANLKELLVDLGDKCEKPQTLLIAFPVDPQNFNPDAKQMFIDLRSKALAHTSQACIVYLLPKSWQTMSKNQIMKTLTGTIPLPCESFEFIKFNREIIRKTWRKILVYDSRNNNLSEYHPDHIRVFVKTIDGYKAVPIVFFYYGNLSKLLTVQDSLALFLDKPHDKLILVKLKSGKVLKVFDLDSAYCQKLYPMFSYKSTGCMNERMCQFLKNQVIIDNFSPCLWAKIRYDHGSGKIVADAHCFFCKEISREQKDENMKYIFSKSLFAYASVTYDFPSFQIETVKPLDTILFEKDFINPKEFVPSCLDTSKLTYLNSESLGSGQLHNFIFKYNPSEISVVSVFKTESTTEITLLPLNEKLETFNQLLSTTVNGILYMWNGKKLFVINTNR